MIDGLKRRYYIWRIRRAYDKKQQAVCDVVNARSEALWYLDRRLKQLSEDDWKRWRYCGDI